MVKIPATWPWLLLLGAAPLAAQDARLDRRFPPPQWSPDSISRSIARSTRGCPPIPSYCAPWRVRPRAPRRTRSSMRSTGSVARCALRGRHWGRPRQRPKSPRRPRHYRPACRQATCGNYISSVATRRSRCRSMRILISSRAVRSRTARGTGSPIWRVIAPTTPTLPG